MYLVIHNSSRDTFEIMKFLNDHKDLGHVFIACNQDFYIFLADH